MKISITSENRGFKFFLPTSWIFSGIGLKLINGKISKAKENFEKSDSAHLLPSGDTGVRDADKVPIKIDRKTLCRMKREIRKWKKHNKGVPLVEVKSKDGEHITVTL